MVAPSVGEHTAGMVRALGGMDRKLGSGAAVRLGLPTRGSDPATAASVLRVASYRDARTGCADRQSLYTIQSYSDGALRGRRRVDHVVVAEGAAKRALARASSRVSAVISSICERNFRCRLSITNRLMITQTYRMRSTPRPMPTSSASQVA